MSDQPNPYGPTNDNGPNNPYGPPNPQGHPPPAGYVDPRTPGYPVARMGSGQKIALGLLIGLFVSMFSIVLAFILGALMVPTSTALLVTLVTLIPVLLAAPMLISERTRSWGVGVMLGLAIGSFVLGGACVSILNI